MTVWARRALLGLGFLVLALPAALAYFGAPAWFHLADYFAHPIRSDFALYYRDARVGLQYGWSHMYDPDAFRRVTEQLGIQNADPRVPSLSFPLLTWLVAPFAMLPLRLAYDLWLGLLIACFLLTWLVAAPGGRPQRVRHLLVAAGFIPLAFGLALGQSLFLVVAAVAGAWCLLRRGWDLPAGMMLAVVVVKPQIALLVPFALLLAGRWRTFLTFLGTTSLILIAVLAMVPLDSISAYASRIASASQQPQAWLVPTNLTIASIGPRPVALALQILTAAVALATAYVRRKEKGRDELAIVAGLLGSLLVIPYIHYQDLTALLLAAWLFLRSDPARWQRELLVVGYLVANIEGFLAAGLLRIVELGWLVSLLVAAQLRPAVIVSLARRSAWTRTSERALGKAQNE